MRVELIPLVILSCGAKDSEQIPLPSNILPNDFYYLRN